MFTKCLQFKIAQKRKKKETKKANVSPYNPLLSKEINKKERKEYNMEYLYTSFNFVYKYILYIIANIKRLKNNNKILKSAMHSLRLGIYQKRWHLPTPFRKC